MHFTEQLVRVDRLVASGLIPWSHVSSICLSTAVAREAALLLEWSLIVMAACPHPAQDLVKAQGSLFFLVLLSPNKRLCRRLTRRLSRHWVVWPDHIGLTLAALTQGQATPHPLPLLSCIAQFCQRQSQARPLWDERKVPLFCSRMAE